MQSMKSSSEDDGRMAALKRQKKAGEAKMTVGKRFSIQLESLMSEIDDTRPHFIRCIKPNHLKKPATFFPPLVNEQLTYSGVLEAVLIMQNGYPFRLHHSEFREKYHMLIQGAGPVRHKPLLYDVALFAAYQSNKSTLPVNFDALVAAAAAGKRKGELPLDMTAGQCALMKSLIIESASADVAEVLQGMEVGKTRIFYRNPVESALVSLRLGISNAAAVRVQACYRRHIIHKWVAEIRALEKTCVATIQDKNSQDNAQHSKQSRTLLSRVATDLSVKIARVNRFAALDWRMGITQLVMRYIAVLEREEGLLAKIVGTEMMLEGFDDKVRVCHGFYLFGVCV